MNDKREVLDIVKRMGAKSYRQGEDWNGNKVYIPVYSKTTFIGLPLVIFEDEKGFCLSTPEEAIDYINKTTVFNLDGEVEENGTKPKFTNFKNPYKE